MAEDPQVQIVKMTIREKIGAFMGAIHVEWVIITGTILVIGFMVWVIFKMGSSTDHVSETIVGKLLDQLSVLEGGLLAWGTQLISAMATRIRDKDSADVGS